jgi:uncharacterized protein (DUF488 family)
MRIAGIGYQGRSLAQVVEALIEAQVDCVVDIRETPWSRKPGLSKGRLSAALESAGIRYVHMRAAGNPKENRRTAQSVQHCLDRYREHLARNGDFLEEIRELASDCSVALLCFEAEFHECHRSVIVEQLASRWGLGELVAI